MPQFFWIGGSGCLLPSLIFFNLVFGKFIFNSTRLWLGVEAVLILLFIFNINITAKKIFGQFSRRIDPSSDREAPKAQGKIIDIQADVVEENKKLK